MYQTMTKLFVVALVFAMVASCSDKHTKSGKTAVITVKSSPFYSTAYYAGTIQPLKSAVITSPADGVITDTTFHYGDIAKAGQLLFTISSEKFLTDYKAAMMQYVKAKNDLSNNQGKLKENEFLYKNELISKDELSSKQTEFYTSQLAFVEAKENLANLLKRLDLKGFNLYELKIDNIEKITQALHLQGDSQKLQIVSPASGVVLLPVKSDGSDGGESLHLGKGDQVKQGAVLAVIGDLNGLRIHIAVNEFNVNQLKLGQKVQVTGTAFPDFTLDGEIAAIDHQAQASQGGVPMFPVEIAVAKLTSQQQAIIHVGMSAKVEVNMKGEDQITLPLTALFEKKGVAYVRTKDEKTGKIKEVAVKTGQTTVDAVVIQEGLKPGDKVLVST